MVGDRKREDSKLPRILRHLDSSFQTLRDLAYVLLQPQGSSSLTAYETSRLSCPQFDAFLGSTFVSFPPRHPISVTNFQCTSHLRDLLHSCISIHLQSSRFNARAANLICLGYRHCQEGTCGTLHGAPAIENHYPNALLNYLSGAHWERLLALVGDEAIMEIFLKAVVIVKTGGGWLQVAGVPITEVRRETGGQGDGGGGSASDGEKTRIRRHRLFYGEPNLTAAGRQIIGLPFKHPLNKFKTSNLDALVEQIFFRGDHVVQARRKSKSWSRLRTWCLQLVRRHGKCPYRRLFDYHCPDTERGMILDGLSFCDGPSEVGCLGTTQAGIESSIWDHVVSYRRVHGYVKSVIFRLLGIKGGRLRSSLAKKLKIFLALRRFETISAEEMAKGLSLRELFRDFPISNPEAHADLQRLLHNFCIWLVEGLVIPLVKTSFYVTESCIHKKRILYFRQDVWRRLCRGAWDHVKANMLDPLPPDFNLRSSWQNLGFCRLRMVPKSHDAFRPIMNLRKPLARGGQTGASLRASVNGMLRNLHSVLDYYRVSRGDEVMGASVMGLDDVHQRWKTFRRRMKDNLGSRRPLFFLKLDVRSCFDSIPQDALLDVIARLLDREQYVLYRYELSTIVNGMLRTRFKRSALPTADARGVCALLEDGGMASSCLLIDRVVGQKLERCKLLRLLEDHVRRNVVVIDGRCYRQKVGIPQGSVLSTLLCSLFYADLDRRYLRRFLEDPRSLLMRFVDDTLFVTADLSTMADFVESVSMGFPDYGVSFNLDKAASNFPHPRIPRSQRPDGHRFRWCGLELDTRTLHVSGDYGNFHGSPLADSLTIDRLSRAAPAFVEYIKMCRISSHPLSLMHACGWF